MKFYRYEYRVEYASSVDHNGEIVATSMISAMDINLIEFNLTRETPKGYWIAQGSLTGLRSPKVWVSKKSRKRYVYPTKEEAMTNLITRTERRIKILKANLKRSEAVLVMAKEIRKDTEMFIR